MQVVKLGLGELREFFNQCRVRATILISATQEKKIQLADKNNPIKPKPCCRQSISKQAVRAIKSFAHWTGQAFRKPNEEQLKTRETICQSNVCGKWKSATDQCSECGCFLKKVLPIVGDVGKRNHADEKCPLDLWKEV